MGLTTSAQAKNIICRSLSELVSRSPNDKEKEQICKYFNDKCAYCDKSLLKGTGHLDHLIPFSKCGKNGMYNRVLACEQCNSKEKFDKDWILFLKSKCESKKVYNERKARIEDWKNRDTEIVSEKLLKQYEKYEKRIKKNFDKCYKKLKHFVKKYCN